MNLSDEFKDKIRESIKSKPLGDNELREIKCLEDHLFSLSDAHNDQYFSLGHIEVEGVKIYIYASA